MLEMSALTLASFSFSFFIAFWASAIVSVCCAGGGGPDAAEGKSAALPPPADAEEPGLDIECTSGTGVAHSAA